MDPFGSLEQLQQYYHSMGMPVVAQPQDMMPIVGEQDLTTLQALQGQSHTSGQLQQPQGSVLPLHTQDVPLDEELHKAQQQQQQEGGEPVTFQEQEGVEPITFQQQQQQQEEHVITESIILMSTEEEAEAAVTSETQDHLRFPSCAPDDASVRPLGGLSSVQDGPASSDPLHSREEMPFNELVLYDHEALEGLSRDQLIKHVLLLQAKLRERVGREG
jgi:hypothetical protein